MKTNKVRDSLKNLTRAMSLGTGLLALTAHGQGTIEVGGIGIIGDTVLDPGSALPTDIEGNWVTEGNEAGAGEFIESHLVSPDIVVPTTGTVTLTFDHRYNFEGGNWDGGAIFVSVDGAAATYVAGTELTGQGYQGTATNGTAWAGGGRANFFL